MKKNLLVMVLALLAKITFAAAPTWSANPGQFQFNMSVVAVTNLNCQELSSNANMVGAFVNGVCRGVAYTNNVVAGKHLAYLLINSNSVSGETVLLKYYDAATDVVYNCKDSIVFSDNANIGTNNNPFNVRNNDAPTNMALSSLLVPENYSVGTNVATITTTDSDLADTHTYSLVAGNGALDNSKFIISGNQLVLNVTVNVTIQDSLFIRLRTTDNLGCYFEKEFILQVVNANDAPTALVLSDTTFFENVTNPTIGTFTALDPDLNETFTYSLVAGTGSTGNTNFSISGSNLTFTGSANYEVQNNYSIRCRVTDFGGLFFERIFTIIVKDVNENPTDLILSKTTVFENEPANQFVAKLSTIDQDVNDVFSYSFANIGTNNNTSFVISNDTLKANQLFDFETKNSYQIYLTTTDSSGLFYTKSITISIKDTLDMPTDILISNDSVLENAAFKTFVGKISTVDANLPGPNVYLYALVAGSGSVDNTSFMVSNDSLYSQGVFDFETKNLYQIRLKTTLANGMFIEKPFGIVIKDTNELPTLITLSIDTIAENTLDSAIVCSLTTTDQEGGSNFVYTLVAGSGDADNAAFGINGNKLLLLTAADFESKNTYNVRLKTTDISGGSLEMPFIIYIKDLNENPQINIKDYTVSEAAPIGNIVGTITASELDSNQTQKFSIISSSTPFSIDSLSGVISLKSTVDYETQKEYRILVVATDNGTPSLADTALIKITVLDAIEENGFFPSADFVSPNNDEKNDYWQITNVYLYKDFSLKIVDQNGQIVYKMDSDYNNDWDAYLNGNALPNGNYYYVFSNANTGRIFKGIIAVVQ
ncbi:MAG: hypothetical protein A3F72_15395 [Bacteroidetes bacterium RIFCSPLOWO2_12_FULL_35_15]|nr:MAG: hypothetical protein A3F72_15395 [Bacteroidetes bacterium RIFCSPLOWO2_12_FULL_35_15]